MNQIFWSDSDYNPMRYADDGYGNNYPLTPTYYTQSPTSASSNQNVQSPLVGSTSSTSIQLPTQPAPPISQSINPGMLPSLQPNEYLYNDFFTFDEWNYKRNKPSLYFTPLLSYPPEYCQSRMLYYNYVPDNPSQPNLIDYFPHLSPQDFHLLTSLYNISIVNDIKPEYLKIYIFFTIIYIY